MFGMFDKDKEIGLILQSTFNQGEHFILWGAEIVREDFPTEIGPATQVGMEVSKTDAPRDRFTVTTLASAIVAKVREAEEDDFPARCFWTLAPSKKWKTDATVLQFVGPYEGATT